MAGRLGPHTITCGVLLLLRRPLCPWGGPRVFTVRAALGRGHDMWCTIAAATTTTNAEMLLVIPVQMPDHGLDAVVGLGVQKAPSLPSP